MSWESWFRPACSGFLCKGLLLTWESAWLYILIQAFLLPAVYFVSYAFLNGRASVIAPLGYVQLPTAALYGWLVFEETPENKTYYGALLIFLAGLILIRFTPKSKYP